MSNDDITDIDWAALLGRASALGSEHPPADLHRDQCVLITGAGGSIGSALVLLCYKLDTPGSILLAVENVG